jgi:hypothetical protein
VTAYPQIAPAAACNDTVIQYGGPHYPSFSGSQFTQPLLRRAELFNPSESDGAPPEQAIFIELHIHEYLPIFDLYGKRSNRDRCWGGPYFTGLDIEASCMKRTLDTSVLDESIGKQSVFVGAHITGRKHVIANPVQSNPLTRKKNALRLAL